jgi:hypothetical protein
VRVITSGFTWGERRFAEVGLRLASPVMAACGVGVEYCVDCGATLELNLIVVGCFVSVKWGDHPGVPPT